MTKSSATSTSISVRAKQTSASRGVSTIGSPRTLKEVLRSTGTAVTEMYAAHWYSMVANWLSQGDKKSTIQFSPSDTTLTLRVRQYWADGLDNYIWDCSYWYSPTFWSKPERYKRPNINSPAAQPRTSMSQTNFRRNLLDDVVFPSSKVILWERFDYSKKKRSEVRPSGSNTRDASPSWHNPQADTNVVTVDGSTTRIKMQTLYDRIASTADAASIREFTPAGNFDITQQTLDAYDMGGDLIENGNPLGGGLYPAWFWATRDGIQGRDLPR